MRPIRKRGASTLFLFVALAVVTVVILSVDFISFGRVDRGETRSMTAIAKAIRIEPPSSRPRLLNVSVLHPQTIEMPPRQGDRVPLQITTRNDSIREVTHTFRQHGRDELGLHYRLQNTRLLRHDQPDALLVLVVLNDETSWGPDRSCLDFFQLIGNFTFPKHQMSLTMLTSSWMEFTTIQQDLPTLIHAYPQLSLIYRRDFVAQGLNRGNRHAENLQAARRQMLARYRNFALLSTLETWHEHVVWLDADVHIIPSTLVTKMIHADRDILEPICYWGEPPSTHEYDRNAWAGRRAFPGSDDMDLRLMSDYVHEPEEFVQLDSVGGTMLYVRADIHRQGIVFAPHYTVGTGWNHDGYDGIETEGMCYAAHFLGYKCWGMPHDPIYHVAQ